MSRLADKVLSQNLSPSGLFNAESQHPRRASRAIKDLGKVRPTHAKMGSQISDGFLEGMRVSSHETSVVCDTIKSRGNEIVHIPIPIDSIGMSTWPQRPIIQKAILAYRKERGLSPEQMAEILEVGSSYLHNLLYDKRVWPSLEVAQKLSRSLGLKLGEVVDDPGALVEGSAPDHSGFDKFMLKTMGTDLSKMTESQKQAGFQVWKAFSDGILGK